MDARALKANRLAFNPMLTPHSSPGDTVESTPNASDGGSESPGPSPSPTTADEGEPGKPEEHSGGTPCRVPQEWMSLRRSSRMLRAAKQDIQMRRLFGPPFCPSLTVASYRVEFKQKAPHPFGATFVVPAFPLAVFRRNRRGAGDPNPRTVGRCPRRR